MARLSRWRGWRSVTDLTTERATELPDPVPGGPDPDGRPPDAPEQVPPDGVQLTRLLSLVRLSAPQAVQLAADLLATAAVRGDRVLPDRAMVSTEGRAALCPDPDGRNTGGTPALAALLADVAAAARLPGRPADPAAAHLLAALDRAATDLPDGGAPAVAAGLQEAAAGIDGD